MVFRRLFGLISWSLRLHSKNLTARGLDANLFHVPIRASQYKRTRSAVCSSALRVLPPGTLVKAIRESSSYRPVLEELGAQCIPRISRLVGFFDRFISLLPGSLFKECLLDINLGGMHFVKCLGNGLHVFWRHCGFGHGPNRRPFKLTRRPLSAFSDPVGNRLRSGLKIFRLSPG